LWSETGDSKGGKEAENQLAETNEKLEALDKNASIAFHEIREENLANSTASPKAIALKTTCILKSSQDIDDPSQLFIF